MARKLDIFENEEHLKFLNGDISLVNGFMEEELNQLTTIASVEEYDEKELILKEDDATRDLFIISKGGVSIEMDSKLTEQSTISMRKLRDKCVFGELSFLDGSRRSANVKAISKTIVFRLPFDDVKNLCENDPRLAYKLMRNLGLLMGDRLRDTNFEMCAYLNL